MSGDHNMHQKPKALALAEELEWQTHWKEHAAEIRRLQAENDAKDALLRQALFVLEPYADVKPRDWKTDREKLWHLHDAIKEHLK